MQNRMMTITKVGALSADSWAVSTYWLNGKTWERVGRIYVNSFPWESVARVADRDDYILRVRANTGDSLRAFGIEGGQANG